jgi:DHA2 family multidrug resistance protein
LGHAGADVQTAELNLSYTKIYAPVSGVVAGLIQFLMQHGLSSADATTATLGVVYRQLLSQSEFLAFMDCFRVFAWLSIVMIPVLLLVHRFKVGGQPTAGH